VANQQQKVANERWIRLEKTDNWKSEQQDKGGEKGETLDDSIQDRWDRKLKKKKKSLVVLTA
jgi:hypothetical protein